MTSQTFRPRLRSLHTRFLEAVEYGHEVLAHPRCRAWTHPDDGRLWHLTDCPVIAEQAKCMHEEPHDGLLRCQMHGITGETHDGVVLHGFWTESFLVEDAAAILLRRQFADTADAASDVGDKLTACRALLRDCELLFADDRATLSRGLDVCQQWAAARWVDLAFAPDGALVARDDGVVVVHPCAFEELLTIPF